jgi:hypothetical protein
MLKKEPWNIGEHRSHNVGATETDILQPCLYKTRKRKVPIVVTSRDEKHR